MRKEAFQGNDYTSARLVSKNKGDWLYGRVEVRAKLLPERAHGLQLDASYRLGMANGLQAGRSILWSMLVTIGNNSCNCTYRRSQSHKGTQVGKSTTVKDCSDRFHVYSIEWSQIKSMHLMESNILLKTG